MKNNFIKVLSISGPAFLGYAIFSISGVLMWLFTMYWFLQWWGLLGILAGLLFPPLASLFPFIYWWQESFPTTYLLLWVVGVVALIAGVVLSGGIANKMFKNSPSKRQKKHLDRSFIEGETTEKD